MSENGSILSYEVHPCLARPCQWSDPEAIGILVLVGAFMVCGLVAFIVGICGLIMRVCCLDKQGEEYVPLNRDSSESVDA